MGDRTAANDYVIRVLEEPAGVEAAAWNALLEAQPSAVPFMRHEYLAALHDSASAVPDSGWLPRYLLLWLGDALQAVCPLYLKEHSYGEYVFDWGWADAYQRHGLRYYPKLLVAVPFTPVPGPRLMARDAPARQALLQAMESIAADARLSSAHLLFIDDADREAARAQGWMLRSTVQFHWTNRQPTPYADFAEFLAAMQRAKRKKIQQERRRVADAGVVFSVLTGPAITRADWDFFYRCYTLTYRAHHSTPYLTRDFFERMAQTMPGHWLLFTASRDGERVADRDRSRAPGRFRPLLGCPAAHPLPALRGLLLPAVGLVHRAALPALRRRRAG